MLKAGVDPAIARKTPYPRSALHYEIQHTLPSDRTCYDYGTDSAVRIAKSLISRMERRDLDMRMLRAYNISTTLVVALIRVWHVPISPQQIKVAKMLVDRGVSPVINTLQDRLLHDLDFLVLILAKGFWLGRESKQVLKGNKILGFLVQDEVEIKWFFQRVRSDDELVDGIVNIGKFVKNNIQKLAFTIWLTHGAGKIRYENKRDVIRDLLQKKRQEKIYFPLLI